MIQKIPNRDHRTLLLENVHMRCMLVPVLAVKNENSVCMEFLDKETKMMMRVYCYLSLICLAIIQ